MRLLSTISLLLLTLTSSLAQAQTSSATTTTTITSTSTLTITRTLVLASQTTTVTLSTAAANFTSSALVHNSVSTGYQTPTGAITQGMAGAPTGANPSQTSLSPYQALGAGSSLDGPAAVYAAMGAVAIVVVAGLA
ncbi:MAG: hypothetical protein MMC33_007798 [Icmadophila ericetorum]|nr:hypothetical protein [Icmadophila ericetorum]